MPSGSEICHLRQAQWYSGDQDGPWRDSHSPFHGAMDAYHQIARIGMSLLILRLLYAIVFHQIATRALSISDLFSGHSPISLNTIIPGFFANKSASVSRWHPVSGSAKKAHSCMWHAVAPTS